MRDAFHGLRACVLGACALLSSLGAGVADAAQSPFSPADVAEQVRKLEAEIHRARERLLLLVSIPRAPGALPLHDEPELRQLALELPALERELEDWAQLETRPARKAGE